MPVHDEPFSSPPSTPLMRMVDTCSRNAGPDPTCQRLRPSSPSSRRHGRSGRLRRRPSGSYARGACRELQRAALILARRFAELFHQRCIAVGRKLRLGIRVTVVLSHRFRQRTQSRLPSRTPSSGKAGCHETSSWGYLFYEFYCRIGLTLNLSLT